MEENKMLEMSSSPHIRCSQNVQDIMRDVVIALCPALLVGVYVFGLRALVVTLVSIAGCVFFEYAYRKLMHKESSIQDLSAVVTGMLLAMVCPSTIPYWMVLIGDFFAIVVVKQLYGGIGKNFVNPALAGRCFLLLAWTGVMTTWVAPASYQSFVSLSTADAVTAATPLVAMKAGTLPEATLLNCFIGKVGGCIGEVSAAAILLGGIYLYVRGVINLRIPGSYIVTVAVLTFLFPQGNGRLTWMAYSLCSGGLMLGAVFMATDYVTSPVSAKGQIIYGVGCGLLTVFIRYFGSYPEGVSFAILIMNVCAWVIDMYTRPRRFGVSREDIKKQKAEAKAAKEAAK